MTTNDSTITTLPCPYCGGTLQQHATGAGLLLHPSYMTRGGPVHQMNRCADEPLAAVIWSCNRCEFCAQDFDVQHALTVARAAVAQHAGDCDETCHGCPECYQRTGADVCDRLCPHALTLEGGAL